MPPHADVGAMSKIEAAAAEKISWDGRVKNFAVEYKTSTVVLKCKENARFLKVHRSLVYLLKKVLN